MLLSRIIPKMPFHFLYLSSVTAASLNGNLKYCFSNRNSLYNQHQYPHFKPTITLAKFVYKYGKDNQNDKYTRNSDEGKGSQHSQESNEIIYKVAGRITSIRAHHKTVFIDIRYSHLKLQIALSSTSYKLTYLKRGDIIGITGHPFTTKKGELSLNCKSPQHIYLLSPCMWMLPYYYSLKDIEVRYRNRPLDLLTNPAPIYILKKRSKTIQTLRTLLQSYNYIEVYTPILSSSCGGAIAKPFITYHNDHKSNLYLRIAPELYLKKLLIGGIQKVFEIGKNFRNYSIDQTHNPYFTSCELYCAYEDYKGMIKFTHKLLNSIAQYVNGNSIIKGTNSKGEKVYIDISKYWKYVDFMSGLEKALGMSLPIDFYNYATIKFYDQLCVSNNIECKQPRSIERLLDKLAGRYLETTHEPHIIMNHPTVMSPLSQPHPTHPHLTQRFELFINNFEVVNSYTELNNPRIQKHNTPNDIDYVYALYYGLMPCAGWGIGIDRFVMLLTGCERIQEVLAFPLLKDLAGSTKEAEKKYKV